ncbi:MAG: hypothetical protein JWO00_24 [Candidatus Parcubacteria bacterium]|nr:hypothetical protein [Candidatus Parcubacteria bacterium]
MHLKDFDSWNMRKQHLNLIGKNDPYNIREIWWCSLGVNIGFEEDGDGIRAERPVVILRGFSKQLCWVVPLTSSLKINRYYHRVGNVVGREASAIVSQFRPVDTKRLTNLIGRMDDASFESMRKAIKDLL